MNNKETAFKWYCIGYREIEYQIEDKDSRMNDDDLRTEFEMEWEYQEERDKFVIGLMSEDVKK